MTSIIPLQKPQSANRNTSRKNVNATLRPSPMTNMPRRAVCGSIRAAPVARGFIVAVVMFICSLERDAHLCPNHNRIGNVPGAAGINNPLQVWLEVTPLCYLKTMPDLDHFFAIGQRATATTRGASEIGAEVALNKVKDGLRGIASWEKA